MWVLFSRGCYDRENKTREYENILGFSITTLPKNKNFRLLQRCNMTKMQNKIPAKISEYYIVL
jgi:hypothetical protein